MMTLEEAKKLRESADEAYEKAKKFYDDYLKANRAIGNYLRALDGARYEARTVLEKLAAERKEIAEAQRVYDGLSGLVSWTMTIHKSCEDLRKRG